ncbi:MAG: hypothetical protein JRJ65_16190, partial [Deltaproteobacteria bacterium]|nr:hypothetical protein [Deltaproteobacteria bacterium]
MRKRDSFALKGQFFLLAVIVMLVAGPAFAGPPPDTESPCVACHLKVTPGLV